ncbi:MAG TPA: DUF3999 family protein [Xanthomonadaceae bacterium]|nr:DUF3999 family protein [Xanthomonadaceae bacterium]
MKFFIVLAGMLLGATVAAATPADYANQWTLATDKADAYAVTLDEGIYRQVTRDDLSDLAAFNADGEELAFGPLPTAYQAPPSAWHQAAWFALPKQEASAPNAGDLQLHVTRAADGSLALDTTLSGAAQAAAKSGVDELLIDVRAKDRAIDGLALDFAGDAPDFSAQVTVEASDDLQRWHELATDAPFAQLRQNGQTLLRRTVEFDAQPAIYLRVHASTALPLRGVQLRLREPGVALARANLNAAFTGRDGRAFIYRLPALVPVERLTIALADDNAVAHCAVSAREQGATDWRAMGDYTAFRLRGAGIAMDAESMDIGTTRAREWRIEPDANLAKTPQLSFDYRPESWVLLTHGRAPYVIVAGSRRAQRGTFPIDALVGQLRARYGEQWRPPTVGHGVMRASAGAAALKGWDATQRRTWLLWGVLVLGAGAVFWMVIGLLRSPPKPKE